MKLQRSYLLTLVISAALYAPVMSHANELVKASERMCEWVKGCALEQMQQQNITPEMKAMMQPMIDSMCANMQQRFSDLSGMQKAHPLYKDATACMNSISKLSCAQMEDPNTKECIAYRERAKKYANANQLSKP